MVWRSSGIKGPQQKHSLQVSHLVGGTICVFPQCQNNNIDMRGFSGSYLPDILALIALAHGNTNSFTSIFINFQNTHCTWHSKLTSVYIFSIYRLQTDCRRLEKLQESWSFRSPSSWQADRNANKSVLATCLIAWAAEAGEVLRLLVAGCRVRMLGLS